MSEYGWCDRCYEVLEGTFYMKVVGWGEEFNAPIVERVCQECATNEE